SAFIFAGGDKSALWNSRGIFVKAGWDRIQWEDTNRRRVGMGSPLRIRMFGPFTVWRGGNTIEALYGLRAPKIATQLLVLLLLYPNRALSKGEAATQLWEGGASEANLNKAISSLGDALGPDGARLSSVSRTVRFTPDAIGDLEEVEVDLYAFERAWEQREQ